MARKVKIDFTGVESFVKAEEGQHVAKLIEIAEKVSSGGNDMLEAKFEITKGNSTGAIVYENFVLAQKSLFKLKGYLEAIGKKADGKLQIDIDNLIGATCIIEVVHEEYNGSMKAKVNGYKKLAVQEEPDEDDFADEEEVAKTPVKTVKEEKSVGKPVKRTPAPEPEPEEEEEEEFEEEEAEPTPPPVKNKKPAPVPDVKKAVAKPAKAPAPKVEDDEDDWDED